MLLKSSCLWKSILFWWLCLISAIAAGEKGDGPNKESPTPETREKAVFDLREVSVFDAHKRHPKDHLTIGSFVICSTEPDKEVKAYPKLKSKKPLYGTLIFNIDISSAGPGGTKVRFVLDESGKKPAAEVEPSNVEKKKKDDQDKPKDSKDKHPNLLSKAKLSSYDRMYIDVNCDGDLTNDPVLRPMKSPPWDALPDWWDPIEKMAFAYFDLKVDYGPGIGVRPFRLFPWLTLSGSHGKTQAAMHFIATRVREGRIRIGSKEYDAILSQGALCGGRWDHPWALLRLKPVDADKKSIPGRYPECNTIIQAYRVDGKIFTTRVSPLGDKLTVEPFSSEFGVFTLGKGKRDIAEVSVLAVTLMSETLIIDLLSDPSISKEERGNLRDFHVPVGDFMPTSLAIQYGKLRFSVCNNYHSEGRACDTARRRVYGIHIRRDKPFVLDFPNKPEVMFVNPVKNQSFSPGEEIVVNAVLIDPVLDLMFRNLSDSSRKNKITYQTPDGKKHSYERPVSLDPLVVITNSSGKKIAEGTMPFG